MECVKQRDGASNMTNSSVAPAEPRCLQTAHYGDTQGEAGQDAPGSLFDQQCRCSQTRIDATSMRALVIALEFGNQRSIANSGQERTAGCPPKVGFLAADILHGFLFCT
jgi:hypothetical protein